MAADPRSALPSVDRILRSEPGRRAAASLGRPLLKVELAEVLAVARDRVARGAEAPPADLLLAEAAHRASVVATGLTPVINATGVILHTNLGRAPLPLDAARTVARTAVAASDLEVERASGDRSRRTARAERLLCALTGAEDALVVNNCAAALVLGLTAIAKGKQVPVSRGELIEIGGEFRIPDILRASGATLVEVGTTNRTRVSDYRDALGPRTGAILKVHPSNYRVVGFTAAPSATSLAKLARGHGVPFLYDVGSGLLDADATIPGEEPDVVGALADGADLVTCSGDKLLGGPQAGIVVGSAELVRRLRRHPLARAVRVDKMQVAALEVVLRMVATERSGEVPVVRMLRESADAVRRRAVRLAGLLDGELEGAHVERSDAVVGGGAMPEVTLPSWAVHVRRRSPEDLAARLRTGAPSVFSRVEDDAVVLDLRTVAEEQVPDLARAVLYALEGDDDLDED